MNPQVDFLVGFGCNARCGFYVQNAMPKTRDRPEILAANLQRSISFVYTLGVRRAVITGGEPTLPRYARRSLSVLAALPELGGWEF